MSWDIGDAPTVTYEQRVAGVLTNGTVTVTGTAPDGTTLTLTPTNPGTGLYEVIVPATMAGTYAGKWTSTGAVAAAQPWQFRVRDAGTRLISLEDGKKHLNIPAATTTDDEEILDHIEAVTVLVEDGDGANWPGTGPILRRIVVERVRAFGEVMILNHYPIISITSIAAAITGGTTYAVGDLATDGFPSGLVRRTDGAPFASTLIVTYVAGRTSSLAGVNLAAPIILKHLWETQRGNVAALLQGEEPIPGTGFALSHRALALLGSQRRGPGIA